jgi:hypothetical protein
MTCGFEKAKKTPGGKVRKSTGGLEASKPGNPNPILLDQDLKSCQALMFETSMRKAEPNGRSPTSAS